MVGRCTVPSTPAMLVALSLAGLCFLALVVVRSGLMSQGTGVWLAFGLFVMLATALTVFGGSALRDAEPFLMELAAGLMKPGGHRGQFGAGREVSIPRRSTAELTADPLFETDNGSYLRTQVFDLFNGLTWSRSAGLTRRSRCS